jgi:hypothetical protein
VIWFAAAAQVWLRRYFPPALRFHDAAGSSQVPASVPALFPVRDFLGADRQRELEFQLRQEHFGSMVSSTTSSTIPKATHGAGVAAPCPPLSQLPAGA